MTLLQIQEAASLRLRGYTDVDIAQAMKVDAALIHRHTNAIQFECGLIMARSH
ncbi:hypothetical protein AB4037_23180 [Labrys sp. KB_33_2]|uniref:hypothetical protein n=1 Tax=Labrys sp. KB_33_2 TaxID=3237479 RepID=UPI003F913CB5